MRHRVKLFVLLATAALATPTSAVTATARRTSVIESQQQTPMAQSGSYRVIVEAVFRKADNFTVTLVFENLSDNTVQLRWGGGPKNESYGPYLIDENSHKYLLQEIDSDHVVGQGSDLLARTKLKSRFFFYGPGQGSAFSLVASESRPRNTQLTIQGVRVTSSEPPPNVDANMPTLVTESYRVVVSDVRKDADNITLTLIFENLLDKTYSLVWGCGRGVESWQSEEPYLIDENADRYYLRKRDDANVVGNAGWGRCRSREAPELLPGTKLKTHFTFKVSGTGSTFTLGSKEHSPVDNRAIVMRNLKVNSNEPYATLVLRDAPVKETANATVKRGDSSRDLSKGLQAYNNGKYAESFDYLSSALSAGQQVVLQVKHHHKGSLGVGDDLCTAKLILTKESLEFQSLSTQTEGERRTLPSHFFRVPFTNIVELKLEPGKESRIHIRISVSKGDKQQQSDWNIYPGIARMERGRRSSLRCIDCLGKSELILKLIARLVADTKG